MTSDDIRRIDLGATDEKYAMIAAAKMLQEIAAQLAELNEHLYWIADRPLQVHVEPGQFPIAVEKR